MIPLEGAALDVVRNCPRFAYLYARDIIEGRWSEVEPMIAQDPPYGSLYARRILKTRWPEYEREMLEMARRRELSLMELKSVGEYEKYFFPRGWSEFQAAWDQMGSEGEEGS